MPARTNKIIVQKQPRSLVQSQRLQQSNPKQKMNASSMQNSKQHFNSKSNNYSPTAKSQKTNAIKKVRNGINDNNNNNLRDKLVQRGVPPPVLLEETANQYEEEIDEREIENDEEDDRGDVIEEEADNEQYEDQYSQDKNNFYFEGGEEMAEDQEESKYEIEEEQQQNEDYFIEPDNYENGKIETDDNLQYEYEYDVEEDEEDEEEEAYDEECCEDNELEFDHSKNTYTYAASSSANGARKNVASNGRGFIEKNLRKVYNPQKQYHEMPRQQQQQQPQPNRILTHKVGLPVSDVRYSKPDKVSNKPGTDTATTMASRPVKRASMSKNNSHAQRGNGKIKMVIFVFSYHSKKYQKILIKINLIKYINLSDSKKASATTY